MHTKTEFELRIARERVEREIETAARTRLVASPDTSFRRSIGRTFIRIGSRLAAEPSLELARTP
jgi:hypothetical protein